MKALGLAIGLALAALPPPAIFAATNTHTPLAPQPTTCIQSTFSSSGDQWWRNINLKLTNLCSQTVDFQNATITFSNKIPLNTSFWGDFGSLSYPDNQLQITSQPSGDNYLASLNLHFPSYEGANSKLAANKSIVIQYGAKLEGHLSDANVYLGDGVATGSVEISNATAKPANVTQSYALLHVMQNNTNITDVQVPWSGVQMVPGLASGNYALTADNVTSSNGIAYKGTVSPATVNVVANQVVKTTVTYVANNQNGKLAIQLQALPQELAGYTDKPIASVKDTASGSSVPVTLTWGAATTVSSLKDGGNYTFSSSAIDYNGYTCDPQFSPQSVTASATSTPTTNLTFLCKQVSQSKVTLNVSGAPSTLTSLNVKFTPNNSSAPVATNVALSNGSGSTTAMLKTGVVYTVSADPVSAYDIKFNPQPLTAAANAIETITLSQQATGTPVAVNGQLTVCGTQLCNEHGVAIQLKGMSSHGIQWYGLLGSKTGKACLTTASLDTLAKDWGANVIRVAMYIQEGGYETDPAAFTDQVNKLIDEATKRGIYVIVDWHMLSPGDPNYNLERAKTFFTAIANAHKTNNNMLYEIANEPNGVPWSSIKSYAEKLIPVIRAIDNKTPILIGTRAWSSLGKSEGSSSQEIISSPVNFPNIMYTFHFYAASHRDDYLNEVDKASNVLPIFVTEFGTQTYSGNGENDFAMADKYMQLFAAKKIGWTNWNYSDDNRSGAVWKTGTCSNGPWTDSNLKPAGVYIKAKIKN